MIFIENCHVFDCRNEHKAILDSGCSKTVCGSIWLQIYVDSLSPHEKEKIVSESSDALFKFGDNFVVKSIKNEIKSEITHCFRL